MIEQIDDFEIVRILNNINQLYKDIDNSWKLFYVTVYQFKEVKTTVGYNDVLLKDNSVVKKSKLVKEMFNISTSLYSRITNLVDRFFILDNNNSFIALRQDVRDFDRTKLMELYLLSEDELKLALQSGAINPYLSISQIRKYIKSLKKEELPIPSKEDLIQAQEILKQNRSLNYHNHITNTDLKKMSKGQIILKYLELQRAYENLKENIKRNGKV